MIKRKNIHFFLKSLFALIFLVVVFSLSPNSIVKAQQMINTQHQTLIVQLQQQITQLQQQLNQLLAQQQQTSPGVPIRLIIPKIGINAVIESLGITPTGEIGVPKGPATTAWFNLGPRPGDIGNAVISGHFGYWKTGVGSVFDNLNKLVKGDNIYVEDEYGKTFVFIVRESKIYDLSADASSVFNSVDGNSHLNLVTCEGVWLPAQKTFTNRFVIFSDKE